MFMEKPQNHNLSKEIIETWNKIGPFDLKGAILDGKMFFEYNLPVQIYN